MNRSAAALLLAAALVRPPTALAEAATEHRMGGLLRRMRDGENRLAELEKGLNPMGARVQNCAGRLAGANDLEGALAACQVERMLLAERAAAFGREIDALQEDVRTYGGLASVDAAMEYLRTSKPVRQRTAQRVVYFGRVLKRARDVRDDMVRQVERANGEFEIAKRRLARRRVLRRGAAALSVFGGVLGAWFLLRRRRLEGRSVGAPSAPAEAGTLGRLLNGNYRVEKELGRGGMGVVYEATDLALKRKVAVKRMSLEAQEFEEGRELFLKEAQLVAALKHPNIVQIYEIFEEGGQVHLVFEHVTGETLRVPMPVHRARKVAEQVCLALDYAHERKVIHRDLKPSNIMVGTDGIVKVMDFGIARRLKGTVTQTQGWGTPAYMAPEQELGKVSKEADFYALGVCLYEMVTGRLPFSGPDFLGQKQRLEYSVEGLPQGLERFLRKALDPDPAKRFHSGAEFAAMLRAT